MRQESHILETEEIKETFNSPHLLYHGIKGLLRCDEAEVVSGIAHYVVSQHIALRFLAFMAERFRGTRVPGIITLIGWLRSFLSVRENGRRGNAVWIARLGNERGVIQKQIAQVPDLDWVELKFHLLPNRAALSALMRISGPSRVLRLARLLHRRHEFFKVLRVVELIGFYARYLEIFESGQFRLAVMSSHSNPHGIAFNLAARKFGVPVVLVTHGMPVRPVAPLSFDLAVVHCEAARQTYIAEGCRMNRVMIHGRRANHTAMPAGPLPDRLTVGIFLCKDVNDQRLRTLVVWLLGNPRVSSILIRPHPKNLWRGLDSWVKSRRSPRLRRSALGPVSDDLELADIVLAGNSSVLVDAVTAGTPGAYVFGLDYGSRDVHAFVSTGLIYELKDEISFDPDAMLRFYQRPNWTSVLRVFANVSEDEASVTAQVAREMRDLSQQEMRAKRSAKKY